jgi:uncharacterized protein (TIGR02466 family)
MSALKSKKHSLWETPLWEIDLDFPIDKLINAVTSHSLSPKKNNLWELPDDIIKEYKKVLTEVICKEISNNFTNYVTNIKIENSWINVQKPGEKVPIHNHTNSNLVSIFYMQAENNSGDLILIDSRGGVNWGWEKDKNYIGVKSFSITPTVGKLLILPSHVLHFVEENKSNTDRISFVADFNLSLK